MKILTLLAGLAALCIAGRALDSRAETNHPPVAVPRVLNYSRLLTGGFATRPVVIAPTEAGAFVIFDGTASYDPDRDPLDFTWFEQDEGLQVFSHTALSTNFLAGDDLDSGHRILLQVSDPMLAQSEEMIIVTVVTPSQLAFHLADSLAPAAYPDKLRQSLLVSLNRAGESFRIGDTKSGVHFLDVFISQARHQFISSNPAIASTFIRIAQELIDTVTEQH